MQSLEEIQEQLNEIRGLKENQEELIATITRFRKSSNATEESKKINLDLKAIGLDWDKILQYDYLFDHPLFLKSFLDSRIFNSIEDRIKNYIIKKLHECLIEAVSRGDSYTVQILTRGGLTLDINRDLSAAFLFSNPDILENLKNPDMRNALKAENPEYNERLNKALLPGRLDKISQAVTVANNRPWYTATSGTSVIFTVAFALLFIPGVGIATGVIGLIALCAGLIASTLVGGGSTVKLNRLLKEADTLGEIDVTQAKEKKPLRVEVESSRDSFSQAQAHLVIGEEKRKSHVAQSERKDESVDFNPARDDAADRAFTALQREHSNVLSQSPKAAEIPPVDPDNKEKKDSDQEPPSIANKA